MGPKGRQGPEAFPPATVASTVVNPVNGRPIPGAQVVVRRRGVVVGTVLADQHGAFSITAPPGMVQISAGMTGFMNSSRFTLLLPRLVENEKVFLPPVMPAGSISFVLTWDKKISDMDLHILTPNGCQAGWTSHSCRTGPYKVCGCPSALATASCFS